MLHLEDFKRKNLYSYFEFIRLWILKKLITLVYAEPTKDSEQLGYAPPGEDKRIIPDLIGIRGKMGAGKDSVANLLQILYREEVEKKKGFSTKKFADGLRECMAIITGIPPESTQTQSDKKRPLPCGPMPRSFLEKKIEEAIICATLGGVGTDRARIIKKFMDLLTKPLPNSPDWVIFSPQTIGRFLQILGTECFRELLGKDVWVDFLFRRWEEEKQPTLITDVRFPNEVRAIKDRGGIVVLVKRQVGPSLENGREDTHISEVALDGDPADFIIDNTGTLEDLSKKVREIFILR